MWPATDLCRFRRNAAPRFPSIRFQQKALQRTGDVPADLACPCCRHAFDIGISRQQVFKGPLRRRLFRYFHCRVCGFRFSRLDVRPARKMAIGSLVLIALVWLPAWLA